MKSQSPFCTQLLLIFSLISLQLVLGQDLPCAYELTSRCFDATCGLELYDTDVFETCECGPVNIGARFSDCKPDGTRVLSYYWKPPAICRGGDTLPPPRSIPCGVQCDEGTYLAGDNSCQTCSPGSASAGGGNIWMEWRHWPAQFSTSCAFQGGYDPSGYPCSSWELLGDSIDSGDQHAQDYLTSNLDLRVHLVRPGSVSFQYKVSAEEGFDYLSFTVNENQLLRVSNAGWTNYSTALPVGFHTLRWQYYKDRSITRGEDRVTLNTIKVVGTSYAATQCDQCPAGHFSDANGASFCTPCPANTYSSNLGASNCTACAEGSSSGTGFAQCIQNRACDTSANSSDLTWSHTACINNTRVKKYSWIMPMECSEGILPPDTTEPCVPHPCLPGTATLGPDACSPCPSGTWSSGNGTECSQCPVGQSTNLRQEHIRNWGNWDGGFTTGCTGDGCVTSGWRSGLWFTDSGIGHRDGANSWLRLTTQMNAGGSINFRYILPCNNESSFTFSINGTVVANLPCEQNCEATEKLYAFQLPSFLNRDDIRFQFEWSYQQRNSDGGFPCNRAIITEIHLLGGGTTAAPRGGSTGCQNCAPGTYSDQSGLDVCKRCDPGYSSTAGASSCTQCSTGYFADTRGTPACIKCSDLTTSNPDHTKCVFDCSDISLPSGRTYDLSRINPWTFSYEATANATDTAFTANGSICDWNPNCFSRGYVCLSADVLVRNRTNTNMGKVISFEEFSGDSKGITLHFNNGDDGCTSHLQIKCDPSGSEKVSLVQPFDSNQCNLELSMNSRYGCPLCSAADYAFVDSPCADQTGGNKVITRTYYQINPYCSGGTPLPIPQQKQCVCSVKNGGCDPMTTCTDSFAGRNCSACPPGYAGSGYTGCIPQCSTPCRNEGICAFPDTCRCNTTGYSGMYCQIPVCDPGCQNGAKCVAPQTCDCSGTGYDGTACENAICDPPCNNGGVCSAANICDCAGTGYYGAKCDEVSGVSKGAVVAIVAVSLLILGGAVAFIVVLYRKHQKLYSEYSRLQSSHIPLEEE